jgi:hypothetical protein
MVFGPDRWEAATGNLFQRNPLYIFLIVAFEGSPMDVDDFQELYKFLRGSKSANPVLDARALFLDNKFDEAYAKLAEAREQFAESRTRVLRQSPEAQVDPAAKDADRQVRKLKRKKEKVEETLEAFDELIPALEKLVHREQQRRAREAATESANNETGETEPDDPNLDVVAPTTVFARASDVSDEWVETFRRSQGDQRLDVLDRAFDFQQVESEDDIHGDTLYYIQTGSRSLLVTTPSLDEMSETVVVRSVVDDRPLKAFTRKSFLRLGTRRKMVLLTRKPPGEHPPAAS